MLNEADKGYIKAAKFICGIIGQSSVEADEEFHHGREVLASSVRELNGLLEHMLKDYLQT